jgi:hypothetical protein
MAQKGLEFKTLQEAQNQILERRVSEKYCRPPYTSGLFQNNILPSIEPINQISDWLASVTVN